ncbi:hypothetical protein V6Z11_A09G044900 [Gossypium hirsutum]
MPVENVEEENLEAKNHEPDGNEADDGNPTHPFKRVGKCVVWKYLDPPILIRGLKALLKDVDKIYLTTDLWHSKPQRIEYMILITYFVNRDWKIQKRVLSFGHIPRPRKGKDIENCIFRCLKEWVFMVAMDNATASDVCIQTMNDTFSLIKSIINNVHDTIDYFNGSDIRLQKFSELVQQFNLKERRLVLECRIRRNSTYDMLACTIKFKEVFSRLVLEDHNYAYYPSADDWFKIEKLLEILKVFCDTTNIISRLEYPTFNFLLTEVNFINVMLDTSFNSLNEFMKDMVKSMTKRFDKYWGECNLLMAIGVLLDPHLKKKLYDEYKALYSPLIDDFDDYGNGTSNVVGGSLPGMSRVLQVVRSGVNEAKKSEVDMYIEEGTFDFQESRFDALEWWKDRTTKFRILSKEIATFSVGSRVIDSYRASLLLEIVQMLICTRDWCRSTYGVKRMNKFI